MRSDHRVRCIWLRARGTAGGTLSGSKFKARFVMLKGRMAAIPRSGVVFTQPPDGPAEALSLPHAPTTRDRRQNVHVHQAVFRTPLLPTS